MAQRNKPITRLDIIKSALDDDSIVTTMEGVNKLIENQGGGKKVVWDFGKYVDRMVLAEDYASPMWTISLAEDDMEDIAPLVEAEILNVLNFKVPNVGLDENIKEMVFDRCSKYSDMLMNASFGMSEEETSMTFSASGGAIILFITQNDIRVLVTGGGLG